MMPILVTSCARAAWTCPVIATIPMAAAKFRSLFTDVSLVVLRRSMVARWVQIVGATRRNRNALPWKSVDLCDLPWKALVVNREDAMLSKENNELICRVGAGTPMGAALRRFWLPALLSEALPAPAFDPPALH